MLVDRLRNEITRLAAVKAIDAIASSPLPLPLAPVLPTVLTELTGFLRKANRPLRQASLSAIDVGHTATQQTVVLHAYPAHLLQQGAAVEELCHLNKAHSCLPCCILHCFCEAELMMMPIAASLSRCTC